MGRLWDATSMDFSSKDFKSVQLLVIANLPIERSNQPFGRKIDESICKPDFVIFRTVYLFIEVVWAILQAKGDQK